jgi:hypothetical protein
MQTSSIRAIAAALNVSERMVYLADRLRRSGRTDLIEAVEHGDMTMAAAIREITGTHLPSRYDKLVLAWNRCDDDERTRFLMNLADMAGLLTLTEPD